MRAPGFGAAKSLNHCAKTNGIVGHHAGTEPRAAGQMRQVRSPHVAGEDRTGRSAHPVASIAAQRHKVTQAALFGGALGHAGWPALVGGSGLECGRLVGRDLEPNAAWARPQTSAHGAS